jgi:predicted metal-dependent phosphoesterase TrpH
MFMQPNQTSLATVKPTPTSSSSVLKEVFRSLHPKSCPRDYNFHMHTTHSDGRLHPEEIVQQAIDIGLKGLAITDHHSVGGYRIAQRWLQTKGKSDPNSILPTLWVGVEVNAHLLDINVHILGYAFDPESDSIQSYLQGIPVTGERYEAASVIDAIHQAGGLAILAHPVRYRRSPVELIRAAADLGIDGSEAYYAYNNPDPWIPSPRQMEQVRELNACYGLLSTCGTDTHGLSLLQRL